MNSKEVRGLILQAFQQSQFKWRTPKGISKDTKIPLPRVIDFLSNSMDVRKSRKPNKQGEMLFTLNDRYHRDQSLLEKIVSKITNRG